MGADALQGLVFVGHQRGIVQLCLLIVCAQTLLQQLAVLAQIARHGSGRVAFGELAHAGEVHGEGVGDAAEWAHCAGHDDVDLVVSHIRAAATAGQGRSDAERQVAARFSQQRLLTQLATVVAPER